MKTFEQICPKWDKAIKTKGMSSDYVINKTTGEIFSHEEVSAKPDSKDRSFRITDYDFLEIGRPEYCIVGEAYGFSKSYSTRYDKNMCVHCSLIGSELSHAIKKVDFELFDILKQDFVDHWNDKHND